MHYHSTCKGCVSVADSLSANPGGTAYEQESDARADADIENNMPYMRGWSGHKQEVVPCMSKWCRVMHHVHNYDYRRQTT